MEQRVGDDEAEDGVAEELEPFVVLRRPALERMRTVRESEVVQRPSVLGDAQR